MRPVLVSLFGLAIHADGEGDAGAFRRGDSFRRRAAGVGGAKGIRARGPAPVRVVRATGPSGGFAGGHTRASTSATAAGSIQPSDSPPARVCSPAPCSTRLT